MKQYDATNPTEEWGQEIRYGWIEGIGDTPEEARANGFLRVIDEADAIKTLHASAADMLPPGTRYEIRRAIPMNYGRSKALAWYHAAPMKHDAAWDDAKPGYQESGGYWLEGRFTTPTNAR